MKRSRVSRLAARLSREATAFLMVLPALALLAAGCSGAPEGTGREAEGPSPGQPSAGAAPSPVAALRDHLPLVIFLGDSITAGYGLPEEEAFPALVERALAAEGRPVRVVNAGVSGDTTSGGLARLDWLLAQEPDLVVVELGANDGLRGLPLEAVEANLRSIVERCREAGAAVLLAGMRVPPSYGPEYSEGFFGIFPRLAGELGVALIPFVLEGVAGSPSLNQADGIHPTAEGHRMVAGIVAPYVARSLEGVAAGAGSVREPAR